MATLTGLSGISLSWVTMCTLNSTELHPYLVFGIKVSVCWCAFQFSSVDWLILQLSIRVLITSNTGGVPLGWTTVLMQQAHQSEIFSGTSCVTAWSHYSHSLTHLSVGVTLSLFCSLHVGGISILLLSKDWSGQHSLLSDMIGVKWGVTVIVYLSMIDCNELAAFPGCFLLSAQCIMSYTIQSVVQVLIFSNCIWHQHTSSLVFISLTETMTKLPFLMTSTRQWQIDTVIMLH